MIGAVDIGGTKIAVGVVDDAGHVLVRNECPSDPEGGFDHAMRRVQTLLRECEERAGVTLRGIGIGCTGPVDSVTGTLGNVNNLPRWKGGSPVQVLSQAFGLPTALDNDANAAALGELHWGAGRSKTRFLYVTVGTGIGVSVIIDGELYRGARGYHPEIGHHIVDLSGPPCTCGVRGCWESLAAGPAMVAWLDKNSPAAYPKTNLTAREICVRAQDSDEWARRAVEHEAYYLGLGLANLITLFAPEAIVLGGSVMKSAHLFLDLMHEAIRQNCKLVPLDQVEITLAALGADAGLVGAAQVWHHRIGRRGGNVEHEYVSDRRGSISS